LNSQVDLGHLKAGQLEAEIETNQEKVFELLGKQPIVPIGDLGKPIIGDHERTGLGRAQMVEAQCRHLGHAEFIRREQPPVTRDDLAIAIDQDRDIEAESFDAVGDLPDLLFAVTPRIGEIPRKLRDARWF
jgi:hypothetical protein